MTSVQITITSSESSDFDMPLQSYKKKLHDIFSNDDGNLGEEKVAKLIIPIVLNELIKKNIDIDSIVHDVVSDFDPDFSEDSGWYDPCVSDKKDSVQEIILMDIGFYSLSSLVLDCEDTFLKKQFLGTKI